MKAAFLTELYVHLVWSKLPRSIWRLTNELRFKSDVKLGVITVPVGFETDFASVPRIPFAWLYAGGCAPKSAVVHDYLYRESKIEKDLADRVFLEAMEVEGIGPKRRKLMYLAVKYFGRKHNG